MAEEMLEVPAALRSGPRPLLPHQVEAVDAAVRALEPPPGKRIPRNGLRATVVSACGTGKTLIGINAAQRLAMYGRVLVLVPTLDLLAQTVREWRAEGRHGKAIAVCSLEGDPALWSAEVRATTSAQQLALWAAGEQRLTVFATYSSLGVLEEAHGGPGYGLTPLAAWDLVVVDEAHRTSGSLGKAWTAIHDQDVIPAYRRLYLTATPRIWKERPLPGREGVTNRLPEEMAASMDDRKIFGPIAYELPLAEAIRRELLARFQVVVLELRDTELEEAQLRGEDKNSEEVRGKRMAAVQTAVLEAMAEHDLKTLITFHARTIEAEAWAAGLPGVAGKLHAEQPGRHPAKDRIWSQWLCGEHEADYRRQVFRQFGEGIDHKGRPVHRAVLANCKVLGEGVDIRAVDSVAIVDPKSSVVEIVQAIGRALRQKPKQGKLATLLVPVFLSKGEKPEDMYASGSYKPLVNVLNALRAHDSRMVEMLAVPQDHTGPLEPSVPIGPPPEGDEEDDGRLLLRFSTKRDPNAIRRFVKMQVIEPERASWSRGYAAAVRYHQEHGDLRVPLSYREPGSQAPLGRWVAEQRAEYAAGRLDDKRVGWLDELSMVWSAPDLAWEENLTACRAYYAEMGTLAAPQTAAVLGRAVGQFLANCRRPGGLGKNPEKAAEKAADLAAIDPEWNPNQLGWSVDWQRLYVKAQTCLDGGAEIGDLLPGVTVSGEDVGKWLARQTELEVWQDLNDEQRRRLQALGVKPPARPTAGRSKARRGNARELAFQRGLEAARRFLGREGHLTVSRSHVEHVPADPAAAGETGGEDQEQELVPVKLGVWISNVKSRRGTLTPERAAALNELGIRWE
ncbi:DEAD/DEAH box helicase [Streptomyces sp. WMMC1477]|uniref:DEAD/DEAH box helicase n=1 Tax=Streptomyces sp. WMMC1477 TaxID=3015155 RepID=UPI0022B629B4|nr:DEAD/DEAH box helicase [Streptomyces sp. WMMC1477]MCZ7430089.1 Helicase associated domain protein [Streptomyces sp. WMMC1477]